MNSFRTLHRSILFLFAVVVVSIVTLIHFSMTKIVAEQSRAHQSSLSPAIQLVIDQVIEPLHIAETLSKSKELIEIMQALPTSASLLNEKEVEEFTSKAATVDETKIFKTLKRLEEEFNMQFFVALEKQRMQYNSDGSSIKLIEDQVNWYFKFRDTPDLSIGDIGKWEDTHFYIDIKIFDANGEFLGFFGVAKSLSGFIQAFADHKASYGQDFIFADAKGDIMLSSNPALNANQSTFINLKEIDWYQAALRDIGVDSILSLSPSSSVQDINNRLVTINEEDVLIAQFKLKLFNWTILLMSPLNEQQAEISSGFMFSAILVLVIIFLLFLIIYNLLFYFRKDIQNKDLVLPYCRINSDEKIKYLVNTHTYKKDAFLALIQLNDFYQKPIITDNLFALLGVGTKVSEFLSESLQNSNKQNELAKANESQWLILLENTNEKEATKFMDNIRHGLATIQTECEKQQKILKFSTCKVALCEVDDFTSAIARLKPVLANIETLDSCSSAAGF